MHADKKREDKKARPAEDNGAQNLKVLERIVFPD